MCYHFSCVKGHWWINTTRIQSTGNAMFSRVFVCSQRGLPSQGRPLSCGSSPGRPPLQTYFQADHPHPLSRPPPLSCRSPIHADPLHLKNPNISTSSQYLTLKYNYCRSQLTGTLGQLNSYVKKLWNGAIEWILIWKYGKLKLIETSLSWFPVK